MKAAGRQRAGLAGALAGAVLGAALFGAPGAQAASSAVVTKPFGGPFSQPVHVTGAPGYDNLVYVTELGGVVRVVRNGVQLTKPFLDISDRITSGNEQGLLSIAFPGDFAESGLVYAYFTNKDCNPQTGGCNIEVAEFKLREGDPTDARERSRRTVIEIPHKDAPNHNGGTAAFGPDGKLWLATGDGGGGNDLFDNASRKNELLGKLLRINPERPKDDSNRGYRVPRDNPFVGRPGRNEIWSIGLRNPFRFSFDGAKIAIGDVGQSAREEIDIIRIGTAKGADFGWPAREGNVAGPHPARETNLPLIDPIHDYPRPLDSPDSTLRGRSVVGGVFVRDPRLAGTAFDPANGRYLFGETFTDPTTRSFLPNVDEQTFTDLRGHAFGIDFVVGFGEDNRDRVYIVSLGSGSVYRLDPAN